MTSQPCYQRMATHILFNISQIKGNQTMKFGQSIKHPKRDIFLEKFLYDDIINLYYRFMF